MSKKIQQIEHKKWERVFEDEEAIITFKYDSKRSMFNPYEVDIKYKKIEKRGVKRTKT